MINKLKQIRDKYPNTILTLGVLLFPIWFPILFFIFAIIFIIGAIIELVEDILFDTGKFNDY